MSCYHKIHNRDQYFFWILMNTSSVQGQKAYLSTTTNHQTCASVSGNQVSLAMIACHNKLCQSHLDLQDEMDTFNQMTSFRSLSQLYRYFLYEYHVSKEKQKKFNSDYEIRNKFYNLSNHRHEQRFKYYDIITAKVNIYIFRLCYVKSKRMHCISSKSKCKYP